MQNVRTQTFDDLECPPRGDDVAGADMALHGDPVQAKRQLGFDAVKQLFLIRSAGGGIADDADLVTRADLRIDEIAHMPENAADRGAETMHDPHGRTVRTA